MYRVSIKSSPVICFLLGVISTVTPENYPKENILHTEHNESLKSRNLFLITKHLLKENYCTRNTNILFFLSLLKLVSKILCHVFIVTFGFWMQYFQTGGLGERVRHPGHHDHRISPHMTSFYGGMFIVTFVTFGFWMQHFQTGGLEEMVRHPGHHDHRISPHLTSFYGGMFIVTFVSFGFWMQHFQTGGLGEMVRQPGHHDHRISPHFDFFLWGYVKDKVFSTPVPDITSLKARITDAFATITEHMLENTWGETDYRLDVSVQQKEHMLKCTDVLLKTS